MLIYIVDRDRLASQNENPTETTLQAKKSLVNLTYRLKLLTDNLTQSTEFLSDGEVLRRQDLLDSLKQEKEKCSRSVMTSAPNDRQTLLSGSTSSSPGMSRRVFGKPEETEVTKTLKTDQLLGYQQSLMTVQDAQLDQLMNVVSRQKELGRMMNTELSIQNEIINELEDRVDLTHGRLKQATKQADRLN
jgi:regulator of vacuolar morphogenesis